VGSDAKRHQTQYTMASYSGHLREAKCATDTL